MGDTCSAMSEHGSSGAKANADIEELKKNIKDILKKNENKTANNQKTLIDFEPIILDG